LLIDQTRFAHDEVEQFLVGGNRIPERSLSEHAHQGSYLQAPFVRRTITSARSSTP
jgi:hypothetical protein